MIHLVAHYFVDISCLISLFGLQCVAKSLIIYLCFMQSIVLIKGNEAVFTSISINVILFVYK